MHPAMRLVQSEQEMTKPVTRALAVSCLILRAEIPFFCGVCKIELRPEDEIQFDHVHADCFNGPHEYRNLRPVHAECHKRKTKQDVQDLAKTKRLASGGRKRRGPKMKSRGFRKDVKRTFAGKVVEK